VAARHAQGVVVEASPAVAAQYTLVVVVVEASPAVAAVAAVAPLLDTTNPPLHCNC
jgi:hypothetical protein